jgi:signal peptidase I
MAPTLVIGDHLLANMRAYRKRQPSFGDIILFRSPPQSSPIGKEFVNIKRVLGVPGDTIELQGGYIMLGGRRFRHYDIKRIIEEQPGSKYVKLAKDGIYVNGQLVDNSDMASIPGFPNEELSVYPGIVIRNGVKLDCYFTEDPSKECGPTVVEPDSVFVMGDNINNSSDSRHWGLIEKSRIMGKAVLIYRPWKRIRLLK